MPQSGPTVRIDAASLYQRLGYLIANMPNLNTERRLPSTLQWLGNAYALVAAVGDSRDVSALRNAADRINNGELLSVEYDAQRIASILYRALGVAELNAPVAAQGAFIPAGSAFDAMIAVGKVLQTATKDVLFVDPYMDEKALTDFAVLTAEGPAIRLLADAASNKPSLKPAVTRWITQYGPTRPIEAKLAPPRTLHDRLIAVDAGAVWILTQSLNAFAARSPASIIRVDPETAALKIAAYDDMWQAATPL